MGAGKLYCQIDYILHAGGIGQGAGTGVFPQGFERVLHIAELHLGAQRHLAMDMDFKGVVVTGHVH